MSAAPLESTISKNILQALRKRGAFAWKVHGGPFQQAGMPDICFCMHGRYGAVETKRPGNKPTPLQLAVIGQIRKAGGYATVAYSVDDAIALLDEIDRDIERLGG